MKSDVAGKLFHELAQLRDDIAAEAKKTMALWKPALKRPQFRSSAANLACYLAMRRHDVSRLQQKLSMLGLSSLGRSEARVLPAIEAVLASLAHLAGEPARPYPSRKAQMAGSAAIAAQQAIIFGRDPTGPQTRIMMTMPAEAAGDPALVRRMVEAGGDCARINCAHDGPEIWKAIIDNVRSAAADLGRHCTILMDLGGPKIRVTGVS
jgi:pyruvate kinase